MEQKVISGTPQPCNAKSLLAFTFGLMARLDRGEITVAEACAQSKLISQANNTMKNEILRAALKLKMYESHTGIASSEVRLREIESKPFDETI